MKDAVVDPYVSPEYERGALITIDVQREDNDLPEWMRTEAVPSGCKALPELRSPCYAQRQWQVAELTREQRQAKRYSDA